MSPTRIRAAGPADAPFLVSMLLEAVNFSPDRQQDSALLLTDPRVANYITGWPRDRDRGFVAVGERGEPLGACWLRYRPPEDPGYGYLDADTPELTIAVTRETRGTGVGRALLRVITADAQASGLITLSLSVEHANRNASRLYRSEGWQIVKSEIDADTMALDLTASQPGHHSIK
jgi:ribosomal protein S18 acetylase RimI-like enzyme